MAAAARDPDRIERLEQRVDKLTRAARRLIRRVEDLEKQLGWVETSALDAKSATEVLTADVDELREGRPA